MSERRYTVAVDCDDTLVPTADNIIEAYQREYGTIVSADDFYSSDPAVWGVEEYSQATERVGRLLKDADFMHSLEPFENATEVVDRLAGEGVDLYIVTGRSHEVEHITNDMVNRYFPGMFRGVEHTNHFNALRRRTKGVVCRELGADMLIDDHVEHISSVLGEGGLEGAIVYGEYGWNRAGDIGSIAVRCTGWLDVQTEVLSRVDR